MRKVRASFDEGWMGHFQYTPEAPSTERLSITTTENGMQPVLHYQQHGEWWGLYDKEPVGFRRGR